MLAANSDGWRLAAGGLPAMDYPHGRARAGVERVLARELSVALLVDQVVRPADRGRDLDHVEPAADAVLLDGVGAALQYGHLRLERRVELVARRRWRRLGDRLQNRRLGLLGGRRQGGERQQRGKQERGGAH